MRVRYSLQLVEAAQQCDNPFMGTEGLILLGSIVALIFAPIALVAVWAFRARTSGRVARAWLAVITCAVGFAGAIFDDVVPREVFLSLIFSGWLFLAIEVVLKIIRMTARSGSTHL